VIYIGINTLGDNQALRDVRVREALNLAIDVDGIIEGIFDGLAVPTVALLTDVDFGFNAELEPYAYDPDRARDLLAEAGHGDGVAVALGTPSGRYVNDVQVAQAVAAQLEAVGFDVDLTGHRVRRVRRRAVHGQRARSVPHRLGQRAARRRLHPGATAAQRRALVVRQRRAARRSARHRPHHGGPRGAAGGLPRGDTR
jgi:hypothetical protein